MNKLTTQRPAWRACAGLLLIAFTVTTCPGFGWVPAAFADAAADLEQARYHFDFGEYDEADTLLTSAIDGGELSGESLRDAYVLRARCALAQGRDAAAQDDFCEVLRLDDAWRPDPVEFTQGEVAGIEAIRAECAPAPAPAVVPPPAAEEKQGKGFFAKPIGWIVTGAVVVGGVVLATGGGGDDGGGDQPQPVPLPDPPAPPAK
jgi:hypothetical protein